MIWTRPRPELRNYWLNTSKLQSCWAFLISRPSVCKWGVRVCGDSSLLLCVTDGYRVCEYAVGLRLGCAGGHLGSNQVLSTRELSFTSFWTSLHLSPGVWGDYDDWTFATPPFPLFHAPIFFFFSSLLLCWERQTELTDLQRHPLGLKTESLRVQQRGAGQKIQVG